MSGPDAFAYEFSPPQLATVQRKCGEVERGSMTSEASGLDLNYYILRPADPSATLGCVVFMHGMQEHAYRYLHVFQLLASRGWAVGALEARGHGLSAGERGYVPLLAEFVADQLQFLINVLMQSRVGCDGRYHLWGQSFGGLLAVLAALDAPRGAVASCLLTSPAMANELSCDLQLVKVLKIGHVIACFAPKLRMVDVAPPEAMSRSVAEQQRYLHDPLNFPGPIMIGSALQVGAGQDKAFARAAELSCPVWIGFGTKDVVNHGPSAADFLGVVGTPPEQKEFKWYEGLYHTLAFEEGREDVFDDMLAFLHKFRQGAPPRA